MQHPERPLCAFAAAFLVLVPIPWHWRTRNSATLSMIAWLFIINMIFGINSSIWAGHAHILARSWCDFATKMMAGTNIGVPATCLCAAMHLEQLASFRGIRRTERHVRRRILFDMALCWGVPVIYMALHYVVQHFRFTIVEGIGCVADINVTPVAIVIYFAPPLLVQLSTLIYAGVTLRHLYRRRAVFSKYLSDFVPSLTISGYFRLVLMVLVQMVVGLCAIGPYSYLWLHDGVDPWISWESSHSNIRSIDQVPEILLDPYERLLLTFTWWPAPVLGFIFFAFYGFTEDSVKAYGAAFGWVRRVVLRKSFEKPTRPVMSIRVQREVEHSLLSMNTIRAKHPLADFPGTHSQSRYSSLPFLLDLGTSVTPNFSPPEKKRISLPVYRPTRTESSISASPSSLQPDGARTPLPAYHACRPESSLAASPDFIPPEGIRSPPPVYRSSHTGSSLSDSLSTILSLYDEAAPTQLPLYHPYSMQTSAELPGCDERSSFLDLSGSVPPTCYAFRHAYAVPQIDTILHPPPL